MLGTPTIADLVRRGEFEELKPIMEKSTELGMQTFDGALFGLVCEGAINEAEALKNADSVNNLKLRIKLSSDVPSAPVSPMGDWGLVE